jgi:uroporphyrinogen-III synthase
MSWAGATGWIDGDCDVILLAEIADRLSRAGSSCEILHEALASATSILTCDACGIYLLEGDDLVVRASSGNRSATCDRVAKRACRDIQWTERPWKPLAISETGHINPRGRELNRRAGEFFESFFAAPLVAGDRLVGVITAQNHSYRRYAEREINLISTVGFLVGLQIEIVRLNCDNASLSQRLASRDDIEQATRILQTDLGLNQRDAYLFLQRQSRDRRKAMKDVAAAIILSHQLKSLSNSDRDRLNVTLKNPELLS